MPLEVACPSCEGKFRVPDTAAGRKIRCPKCKGAIEVPTGESPESEPEPAPPPTAPTAVKKAESRWAGPPPEPPAPKAAPKPTSKTVVEQWFLKGEDGESYGPVAKPELDAWKQEGRITADCQLLREGTAQWQWASEVFPELDASTTEEPSTVPATKESAKVKKTKAAQAKAPQSEPAADEVGESEEEVKSTRSKAIAGLLGIFLGPVGAHRFYLGYWGLGIAMLFTGGGCGLWSLIDGIFILLGKIPDADGRPLSD